MLFPWKKKRVTESADALADRYIHEIAREKLGIAQDLEMSVSPPPHTSHVLQRRVQAASDLDLILWFHPFGKDRDEAQEHIHRAEALNRHGVQISEIVFSDLTKETRKQFGFDVVAEKYGDVVPTETPWRLQDLIALARLFREMHGVVGTTDGRPWRKRVARDGMRRNGVGRWMIARWDEALEIASRNLARKADPVDEAPFREKSLARLEATDSYELVHGAPTPSNVLRLADGGFLIRDSEDFHFGYRELDLVHIENAFFGGAKETALPFLKRYFEGVGDAAIRRFKALRTFFLALYHLERAADLLHELDGKVEAREKSKIPIRMNVGEQHDEAGLSWDAFLRTSGIREVGRKRPPNPQVTEKSVSKSQEGDAISPTDSGTTAPAPATRDYRQLEDLVLKGQQEGSKSKKKK